MLSVPEPTVAEARYLCKMARGVYQCSTTGKNVQAWFDEDDTPADNSLTPVSLRYPACARLHLVNRTGRTLQRRNFEILLDLGPDIASRAAITDKGYDAKANRDGARKRGICPVIPYKSNAIDRPVYFPKALYKARARIEQAVGKLKRFKRIALRCEKTAKNFGFIRGARTRLHLDQIRPH